MMLDSDISLDLDAMFRSEIKALEWRVKGSLVKADRRRRQEAIRAARRAVDAFGLTLEEIVAFDTRARRLGPFCGRPGQAVMLRSPREPGSCRGGVVGGGQLGATSSSRRGGS